MPFLLVDVQATYYGVECDGYRVHVYENSLDGFIDIYHEPAPGWSLVSLFESEPYLSTAEGGHRLRYDYNGVVTVLENTPTRVVIEKKCNWDVTGGASSNYDSRSDNVIIRATFSPDSMMVEFTQLVNTDLPVTGTARMFNWNADALQNAVSYTSSDGTEAASTQNAVIADSSDYVYLESDEMDVMMWQTGRFGAFRDNCGMYHWGSDEFGVGQITAFTFSDNTSGGEAHTTSFFCLFDSPRKEYNPDDTYYLTRTIWDTLAEAYVGTRDIGSTVDNYYQGTVVDCDIRTKVYGIVATLDLGAGDISGKTFNAVITDYSSYSATTIRGTSEDVTGSNSWSSTEVTFLFDPPVEMYDLDDDAQVFITMSEVDGSNYATWDYSAYDANFRCNELGSDLTSNTTYASKKAIKFLCGRGWNAADRLALAKQHKSWVL